MDAVAEIRAAGTAIAGGYQEIVEGRAAGEHRRDGGDDDYVRRESIRQDRARDRRSISTLRRQELQHRRDRHEGRGEKHRRAAKAHGLQRSAYHRYEVDRAHFPRPKARNSVIRDCS